MDTMDIIGGVILIDPDTGQPYAAPNSNVVPLENNGVGILGGVVLIDPVTGNPYKLDTPLEPA